MNGEFAFFSVNFSKLKVCDDFRSLALVKVIVYSLFVVLIGTFPKFQPLFFGNLHSQVF
ncbi:hypothetical protein ND810_08980 [Leptospira levettii]|uniref:Uncharacterized protein n=1 Tax=Leptospira levettii TaxID=2023178 RepID=A0AAW5V2T1_9LEPT|nr:hypothetical protein [Leptospira levettii]